MQATLPGFALGVLGKSLQDLSKPTAGPIGV
jgi:hypothetical protein